MTTPTESTAASDIEALCELMHLTYEQTARYVGWATQESTRAGWDDLPEANKATMRVAVAAVAAAVRAEVAEKIAVAYRHEEAVAGKSLGDWTTGMMLAARIARSAAPSPVSLGGQPNG